VFAILVLGLLDPGLAQAQGPGRLRLRHR